MHNEISKKPKSVIAAVTIAALLLGTIAISMTSPENAFANKYENNQATSTSNSCLNPSFESSTFDIANNIGNCGNTVSQQAEGGEASSPITVQTASPTIEVQSQPPEPPSPPPTVACEECFAVLTPEQVAAFEAEIGLTIQEVCEALQSGELSPVLVGVALSAAGVPNPIELDIINCLLELLGMDGGP
jgi:hypothetical protein